MAIYHFSVKAISRGAGRSAVACAAYRSGEKLVCDYYGIEQDYTKKSGVEFTNIYAPENTKKELLDRQKLWNAVEKSERRKDALLAREFEIAFPKELSQEQRQALLDELCQGIVKKHGVVVDAAIHAPHVEGGSDDRNYHAHIMFTTRAINKNGTFEAKKYRDFSRDDGTKTVSDWREHFADLVNTQLEQIGSTERVSHLSYADLGNGLEATKQRRRVKFISAEDLTNELNAANRSNTITNYLETMSRIELLIIDEIGYLELSKETSSLFFRLISKRYEKASTIVTSNKEFQEWGQIFGDDVIATAILDRLLHHSHPFLINGPSWRMKDLMPKSKNKQNLKD